ncbi:hypothetical protein QBC45DRAFT_434628 [Copromyces sp. CBS 386.78]|nr:hypothetical protein QBC45DRAFT_434628 [Copromyces sp. CBS 386.78]
MSRALDESTIAALKAGNPQAAYNSISSVLVSPPPSGRLEIEILGKGIPLPEGTYVLQDGISVGVSKLGLVQAFLIARKILQDHIIDGSSSSSPQTDDGTLFAATAVILLMDPEFLTAANTRKRLVQKQLLDDNQMAWTVLTKEKAFLDSLLTSRLHRHTKSPTLWNHRRWLVGHYSSRGLMVDVVGDIKNIVSVAGERHPRNYYAWCHARYLAGILGKEDSDYENLLMVVKHWCCQHHNDVSGWSFLYYLLDNLDRSRQNTRIISSTFSEVLNYVASCRLTNESVWVFLRTLAASGRVSKKELERFTTLGAQFSESCVEGSTNQRVLRSALDWYETYRCRRGL